MAYSTHLIRHLRFTIGRNMQELRLKHNLTLRRLSRLCNIKEQLLDQYELGKKEIQLDELLKIACVFEVSVQELMEPS